MKSRYLFLGVALLAGAILLGGSPAQAVPAGLGAAGGYAALSIGGGLDGTGDPAGQINVSNYTVNGNVFANAGPGSPDINNAAPSTINGNVFLETGATYGGPGALNGSTSTLSAAAVTAIRTDLTNFLTNVTTSPVNQTITGDVTTATTITRSGPTTVVDITGGINLNNNNLTFSGNPGDQFYVIVSGDLALTGTASIISGVGNGNVFFIVEGTGTAINTHVGDVMDGVYITTAGIITLDGTQFGEIIQADPGGTMNLLSQGTLNGPTAVPIPPSALLLGSGLLGLVGLCWRRKK